ncbi:hypothetical protein AVEN_44339-1 [Araneus ventricosus]|uniref:Uncharacterized protein n=1 Tax=Araneus ventricosus TaxID=182803 RepID=A0A4Y2PYQ8_ARAVE|nr:hypothetical protein AVEN_44339-1 [Araneus ventricosus]
MKAFLKFAILDLVVDWKNPAISSLDSIAELTFRKSFLCSSTNLGTRNSKISIVFEKTMEDGATVLLVVPQGYSSIYTSEVRVEGRLLSREDYGTKQKRSPIIIHNSGG